MWPDRRLLDLLGIELPIVQAPMAGATDAAMAIAVSESGGLGSLPCALLTAERARAEIGVIRQRTSRPVNVNFFCHAVPDPDAAREELWKSRLAPYGVELGPDPSPGTLAPNRTPFNDEMCDLVEEFEPEVVSFHFGLPEPRLLGRVKALGCKVLSSATTVDEARWLADHGCDAVIAQGYEAGGHRGMFLTDAVNSQPGTMALVPQVVDAVDLPVVAAGGIADGRGIAAAFALGAAGVQNTADVSGPFPDQARLGGGHQKNGGGGGNRTRVRKHSAFGSTCVAASIRLTVSPPDGQGCETASLQGFNDYRARRSKSRACVSRPPESARTSTWRSEAGCLSSQSVVVVVGN